MFRCICIIFRESLLTYAKVKKSINFKFKIFTQVIITGKDFNLWTICNNHLYKHFNLINFNDFLTLAYIIGDSLKTL